MTSWTKRVFAFASMLPTFCSAASGAGDGCVPAYLWPTDVTKHLWVTTNIGKREIKGLRSGRFIGALRHDATFHGVDLSKWQSSYDKRKKVYISAVDFDALVNCGAKFAILKVTQARLFKDSTKAEYVRADAYEDPALTVLWSAAVKRLAVGPYHFFKLRVNAGTPDTKAWAANETWPQAMQDMVVNQGRDQADHFVDVFLRLLRQASAPRELLPIALDVEQEWESWAPALAKPERRERYALNVLYQQGMCAWFNRVRERIPGARFMIYTRAGTFATYGIGSNKRELVGCELTAIPVWLAWYRMEGEPHYAGMELLDQPQAMKSGKVDAKEEKARNRRAEILRQVKQACQGIAFRGSEADVGNCPIHQYSELGTIGVKGSTYIDLNRLHVTKQGMTELLWTYSPSGAK